MQFLSTTFLRALTNCRRVRLVTSWVLAIVLMVPLQQHTVHAYQAGGSVSMAVQTGYSGLTTTISVSDSSAVTIEPGSFMNSGRDWSVDGSTYTPNVTGVQGLQWVAYGSGCPMPAAGATTGSCSKGTVTFTFSRPVADPAFHIHDFGGRMEANCKLAIQGTMALASSSPAGATFTKLSGGITVSGTSITGRAATAPMTESSHSSGTVRVNGTVQTLTFNYSVILTRQGSTCSYDNGTMLMSAGERLNATFSYGEDLGDGPSSLESSSAASHVIGDLKMGSASLSAEAATTLNSSSAPITASPLASANATGDNDDAISGSPVDANIGQNYSLTVPISGASQSGQVCGYIDLDNSGTYSTSNPNERACTNFSANATSAAITWTSAQWPAGATPATVGLRLRASYGTGASSPTGPVDSGEVEDYRIALVSPVPPAATPLQSTGTQDSNQTLTPATSQGQFVAGLTCIVSGATCVSSLVVPNEGTYTVNANGSITFDPLPSFTGNAAPISYRIEDSQGRQSTSTASATVVARPTALDDSSSTTYNTAKTVAVLGNDSSAAGTTLDATSVKLCDVGQTVPNCTASSVTVPNKGTFTRNSLTGEITFTPLSTFAGSASIDYQVADSLGGIDGAQLSMAVAPPDAPSASPTQSSGKLDTNQTITLSAAAGAGTSLDPLQTCIVSGSSCVRSLVVPNEGTYTVNANGTVTFDPLSTFTGNATPQQYRVFDAVGQQAQSTLSLTVAGVPQTQNDSSSGAFDTNQTISVLGNDSAGSGTTLTPSTVRICTAVTANASCTLTSLVVANEGTYTVNANGTITFDPLPTFIGNATDVKYVVSDGFGQTNSALIDATVSAPNAVVPAVDTSSGIAGQNQTVNPLQNDSAPSGVTKNAASVRLCGSGQTSPNCTATSVTVPNEGTYTVNTTTGEITFAPTAGFSGPGVGVTYVATDSLARTFSSTYSPSVVPPPTLTSDVSTGAYDVTQTISVLSNDAAASGTTLNASSVRICTTSTSNAACTLTTLTVPNEGTYTVNPNGTITFDPLPSFAGTATQIKYVASDALGQTASSTIRTQVATPPAPIALPESKTLLAGQTALFSSVVTPTGLVSGNLVVAGNVSNGPCLIDPSDSQCKSTFTIANQGTWTIDQTTGIVSFAANPNVTPGSLTSVAYRVTDLLGRTATASLTPVIPAAPTATPDQITTAWNTSATSQVLNNDAAGTGTTLSAASVALCGRSPQQVAPSCTQSSVTIPNEGTFRLGSNGSVVFEPLPTFVGQVSPVSYQVSDALGQTATATVQVTVQTPAASIATSETRQVSQGAEANFSPLLGTSGLVRTPTGAPAVVPTSMCMVNPANNSCTTNDVVIEGVGTYSLNTSSGIVTFTSLATAPVGPVTPLTYRITDALGRTVTAQLTPTVYQGPAARDDMSVGAPGTTQWISLLGNDTPALDKKQLKPSSIRLCAASEVAPQCSKLSVTVPNEGTYSVTNNGIVKFVPHRNFTGASLGVQYIVKDSANRSASARISPKIESSPVPVANPDYKTGKSGSTISINPLSNDKAAAGSVSTQGKITLLATSVRLCSKGENVPSCSATEVVTPEGTYRVNTKTGVISFTHAKGFSGTALHGITYQVTNSSTSAQNSASSVFVPTVAQQPTLPTTGLSPLSVLINALILLIVGIFLTRLPRKRID